MRVRIFKYEYRLIQASTNQRVEDIAEAMKVAHSCYWCPVAPVVGVGGFLAGHAPTGNSKKEAHSNQ